jgi:hypothetical protein
MSFGSFRRSWYTGSGVSSETPGLFPVAIAGRGYMVDFSPDSGYQRTTIPLLRQGTDQGDEAGEQSLNNEGYWLRYCDDWSYGAGQKTFDKENSLRGRFLESKGVDVFGEPEEISLLPESLLRIAATSSNAACFVAGSYFYVVNGTTLRHTTDPSVSVPTMTTVTTTGLTTITGWTTDGSNVYVCDGVKIMRSTNGSGTASNYGSYAADIIGYANGRLLAANDNVLVEVTSAGASTTTLMTHQNTAFRWSKIVGAANGIYVIGTAGSTSEVYYIGINTSTGALLTPVLATNFVTNEVIYDLVVYAGVAGLATSKGFRLAEISDASLQYGTLIETTSAMQCLTANGNSFWGGWTNYDSASSGIMRIEPGTFTSTFVPAYASDLMASVTGAVLSVAIFNNKRYFVVSNSGVWGEGTNKVTSGTISSSWITYGVNINKIVTSLNMRFESLVGSITAELVTDNSQEIDLGGVSQASLRSWLFQSTPRTFERIQVNITLNRDSVATTTGPTISAWTLRALPAGSRIDEIVVPLVIKTEVRMPTGGDGTIVTYAPLDEFQFLKDLENTQEIVIYQEGTASYSVRVDRVQIKPYEWNFDKKFFNGLITVRLLTLENN